MLIKHNLPSLYSSTYVGPPSKIATQNIGRNSSTLREPPPSCTL